jgi:phage gp36-like protein
VTATYLTIKGLRDATSNIELAQATSPRELSPVTPVDMGAAIDALPAVPGDQKIVAAFAKIQQRLDTAQSMIDGYLRPIYSPVPLLTPPESIVLFMVDITRYLLVNVRTDEQIEKRYANAIAQLKLIATGTIVLDVQGTDAIVGDSPDFAVQPNCYSDSIQAFEWPRGRSIRSW